MNIQTKISQKIKGEAGQTICIIKLQKEYIVGENNRNKTSPKWMKHFKYRDETHTRHAEEHALQLFDRKKISPNKIKKVVVIRFLKNGHFGMSKPCKYCQYKFWKYGIKPEIIYFSNQEGLIEGMI